MKYRLFIANLCFLFSISFSISFGQTNIDTKSTIQHIRTVFNTINHYKAYNIVTLDDLQELYDFVPDGAEVKGYFKNDTLQKCVLSAGISNGIIIQEDYYEKNQLIFVFISKKYFKYNNKNNSFDYSKYEQIVEERYYFSDGVLIHSKIDKDAYQSDVSAEASATQLLEESHKIRAAFYKYLK